MTRPLTPAEEAEAGRVLVAAARDEDVYPVVDGEEEDGVDGLAETPHAGCEVLDHEVVRVTIDDQAGESV